MPDYRGWQYHFSICYVGDSIRETLDITTDILQRIPQIKPSLAILHSNGFIQCRYEYFISQRAMIESPIKSKLIVVALSLQLIRFTI